LNIGAEEVWNRIERNSGEEFRLVRGRPFTYTAAGRTIQLHTTNWMLSRTAIDRALERCPLKNTTSVQDLSAPSYIYALLTDPRIRRDDW
jgi:hypothetical protein